jgi:galactose mutarotase-like enzyme
MARFCRIIDEARTWEEVSQPAAIPPHAILLVAEREAMPDVLISNGVLSAAISPQGAELRSLRMKGFEYMWQREADRPSGIATVLFPNCGGLFQGRYTFEGHEYALPGHGFAKKSLFRFKRAADGASATFTLESDDTTRAQYPFDFSLALTFRLEGATLHAEATVRNTGSMTMPFAYGGHPGFNVPLDGGGNFEDWVLDFAPGTNPNAFEFGGHGLITGHTHAFPLVNGRRLPLRHELVNGPGLFLENVGSEITLRSETSPRAVTMRFPDMPYLGLWHEPGEEARYLCLEPWAGLPSYVDVPDDFATRPHMIRLAPGAATTLRYSIELR